MFDKTKLSRVSTGRETNSVYWLGDVAHIAGMPVGKVWQTPASFCYEVSIKQSNSVGGQRQRRRDACRQVDLAWRRLLAQPADEQNTYSEFVEHVRFLSRIEEDAAKSIAADSVIGDFADKSGLTVRRISCGYIAWRLSFRGQSRDLRWNVVKSMPMPELVMTMGDLIDELS
jgi:hypothetical protein